MNTELQQRNFRDRMWMEAAHYGDDKLAVVVGLTTSDLLVLSSWR